MCVRVCACVCVCMCVCVCVCAHSTARHVTGAFDLLLDLNGTIASVASDQQQGSVLSSSSAVHAARDIADSRICNGMRQDVLPRRRDATPLLPSS